MGMDVTVTWTGKYDDHGNRRDRERPGEYVREPYGVDATPCELCPMIDEVLSGGLALDEDGRVIAGNLHIGAIPAAVLRERLPAAQDRARTRHGRWGDEQAANLEAFVSLVERLEFEAREPRLVVST